MKHWILLVSIAALLGSCAHRNTENAYQKQKDSEPYCLVQKGAHTQPDPKLAIYLDETSLEELGLNAAHTFKDSLSVLTYEAKRQAANLIVLYDDSFEGQERCTRCRVSFYRIQDESLLSYYLFATDSRVFQANNRPGGSTDQPSWVLDALGETALFLLDTGFYILLDGLFYGW